MPGRDEAGEERGGGPAARHPVGGGEVVAICRQLGFAGAGVADATPTRWARELGEWLGAGKHGSMHYLEARLAVRLDPQRLLPGARSVVMVADLYARRGGGDDAEAQAESGDGGAGGRHGRVARYARGRDYHAVIKKRLHALCDALRARFPQAGFRAFVDTAPVLEREYAQRAGLGWIGKHTLLIHPRLGSYTLLGGVMTTLELTPPADQRPPPDHCGTCTRCIDACPTGAITPYSVDAARCISYLTIEHRGAIGHEFHGAIGDWLYGCDICQEVCPHNSARTGGANAIDAGAVGEAYRPARAGLDVLRVLGWSEDDRRREFTGSAMKRATLEMMRRNALIVAGNLLARRPDPELLARIRAIAHDPAESDLVRETAAAVVSEPRASNEPRASASGSLREP